jgi:phenylacetate-CoA ligase
MSLLNVVLKMLQAGWTERLDPDTVRRLQQQRLRRLLVHVLAKSKFYREYYRRHGITADKLDGIELEDLPRVNKQMVTENFDALVCDPAITRAGIEQFLRDRVDPQTKYRGRYHVMHTSGSTGSPGIFVYEQRAWDLTRALLGSRVLKYRPSAARIRYAFILKTDGHHAGVQMSRGAPRIAFKLLPISIDASLDKILPDVQRFQPHLLAGYASGVHLLAQQQQAGRLRIAPRRIISSSEPLTDAMKQTISSAFGVVPLDLYAAGESLTLGISCRHDRGIHLFTDWHCVETADADGGSHRIDGGKPTTDPIRRGRLILTNLYNYTQPLIRYEMSDVLIPAEDRCPCGSPFPLIRQVAGRVEETLWFERRDGSKDYIHWSVIIGLRMPGVEKWQAVQAAPNELLLRLKIPGEAETTIRRVRDEIGSILRHKQLDAHVRVRTEVVDDIPNDPRTGKYRQVIPYRGSANASK